MTPAYPPPAWHVSTWLNIGERAAPTLDALRGKVVVIHAFQMLCPGCVSHSIPQAKQIQQSFDPRRVQVIGLHTVFEHHEAMGEAALRAFAHEYRLSFPIGIDTPAPSPATIPLTMKAWHLEGTPSIIILDAKGNVRLDHFGPVPDLQVGAVLGQLLAEADFSEGGA